MKKLYSAIMLLAMMVAALSLTACGGDDEEDEIGGEISSSGDFIELTIDGKTYHKELVGIYSELEVGENDMLLTGTIEDVFDDEGFHFFMALAHTENKQKLLSSPTGTYSVGDKLGFDDEPENLCFFPDYERNRNNYKLRNGSHQVTSIKQAKHGIQVRGTFKVTMYYDNESVRISGKYGVTVL